MTGKPSRRASDASTQAPWRCRHCGTDIYKSGGLWRHRYDARIACPSFTVAEPLSGGSTSQPAETTATSAPSETPDGATR